MQIKSFLWVASAVTVSLNPSVTCIHLTISGNVGDIKVYLVIREVLVEAMTDNLQMQAASSRTAGTPGVAVRYVGLKWPLATPWQPRALALAGCPTFGREDIWKIPVSSTCISGHIARQRLSPIWMHLQ